MIRRLCILCILVALWPGLALAQSAALTEASKQFTALYEKGRYGYQSHGAYDRYRANGFVWRSLKRSHQSKLDRVCRW